MCSKKIKNVNLNVFKVTTRTNKPKTLIKYVPCKCKCKFHDVKYNSNQKWNNNKC